jgi:hypothetical protein
MACCKDSKRLQGRHAGDAPGTAPDTPASSSLLSTVCGGIHVAILAGASVDLSVCEIEVAPYSVLQPDVDGGANEGQNIDPI